MTCGIYKITSPNGKCYIGQSVNIERRWSCHKSTSGCFAIRNAIDKYGKENMTFEILQNLPKKKVLMNSYEIYYIELYNSLSPNGYNLKSGGESCLYSEESKKRLSESHMGQIAWNKGQPSHNKGKPMREEQKIKISKANKGRIFSEQSRKNMSDAHKGKPSPRKGKKLNKETGKYE